MANLVDNTGDATSNLVVGTGTTSAVFTMPGSVALSVESVVATISNGGSSATTPKITVRDQSGVVIATNTQDDAIPAGDTGTATFALRLGAKGGGIRYRKLNVGGWLEVKTTATGGSTASGVAFLVEQGEFDVIVTGLTGAFHVEAPFVYMDAGGGIFRFLNSSLFDVAANQFAVATTQAWGIANPKCGIDGSTSGDISVQLSVGKALTVYDHLGNAIFEVDENGDLHGKTGKALVFDL